VAYFGPEATFTHLASRRQFGHMADFLPEQSIPEVFEDVERGKADYGVVPIENSTEGVVSHTLDMFLDSNLQIYAEIVMEVRHNLLSKRGALGKIKHLYSHRQAVAQCRQWLRKHLPAVPIEEVASTAEAAKRAAADPSAGAIASEYAADVYRLKVVERGIEDQKNNFTRFLVIGRHPGTRSGNDLTSIMFSVKDQAGILWRALGTFARRGINLTKIESRPLKGKAWEYVFFAEMDGHVSEPKVKQALKALEKYSVFVKVLGSFPKARKEYQRLEV
jgi:chorismate mutase/prephenate dehydratase